MTERVSGLAAQRFTMAISVGSLISLAIAVAAIAWFNSEALGEPSLWILFGLIGPPEFGGLAGSIALARWSGYRLVREAPPGGGG